MKKNIYQLLLSRAFAEFGASMYAIVLPLLVLELSSSLTDVGFFYGIIKLPSILLLPMLGVYVEKTSRKKLIFLCYLFSFLLFATQLLLFSIPLMSILLLGIIGILINLSASVADVATRVIFSEIVPADQLEKYNGTKSIIDNSAIFIAPMLGTFLYGIFGIQIVVGLIVVFYSIAALGIYFLRYTPIMEKKTQNLLGEMKAGLQFVQSKKPILAFFFLATTLNFFVAPTEEIINPGILIAKYGIPTTAFGFSTTFNIIGVLLAGIFIVRNQKINFQKYLSKLFIISSLIMIAIGVFSLLLQNQNKYLYYSIFLILQVMLGFSVILVNVPLSAYFQSHVPVAFQGRFFAFFSFAANLSIPFGISYTGFLAQHIGADVAYILNNLVVIGIVIFTYRSVVIIGSKEEA